MDQTKARLRQLNERLEDDEDLDLNTKMEILDEILEIQDELGISKRVQEDSSFECFGCGS